jgi:hypothetical protein
MYSLLHDARAVNLVNERLSDRKVSPPSSKARSADNSRRDPGPGKYRANATLQACGVVTKLLNRRETRDTAERSLGDKCDKAWVKISVATEYLAA